MQQVDNVQQEASKDKERLDQDYSGRKFGQLKSIPKNLIFATRHTISKSDVEKECLDATAKEISV